MTTPAPPAPAATISHPFRLTLAGDVATCDPGSDQEAAEAVIAIISTIGPSADGTAPGERALVPGLGLADPTFGSGVLDVAGINAQLGLHGPADVAVTDATITDLTPGRVATVLVTFSNGAAPADAGGP